MKLLEFLIIFIFSVILVNADPSEDDVSTELMTTPDTFDTSDGFNCTQIDNCDDCIEKNCTWLKCANDPDSCVETAESYGEFCHPDWCNDTTTTTTEIPTTTTEPETTTTAETTTTETTTTSIPTTTNGTTTTTTTSTTTPSTTSTPTTNGTTTTTVKPTTTVSPAPAGRHFDGLSFFGGIVLASALVAIGFAGYTFYKKRALAHAYSNF